MEKDLVILREATLEKTSNHSLQCPTVFGIFKTMAQFMAVEVFNPLILLMKRNRIYHFDDKFFRGINIGSSTICPTNWLGISGGLTIFFLNSPRILFRLAYHFSSRSGKCPFEEFYKRYSEISIMHHDLRQGIPFPENTIPYLY